MDGESSTALTPEERARALVEARTDVPGGPWFVDLHGPSAPPLRLGPYANPALARDDARGLREFLAAVIREAGESAAGGAL